MAHMQQANVALITARSNKSQQMDHFFCTDAIMETKCGERTTQSCMFPLYLYPDPSAKKKTMFDVEITEKTANINPRLIVALQKMLGEIATSETPRNDGGTEPLAPEAIFNYIYAVLYSNVYREKYADFLKRDFPRVPFTRDYELFVKLGGLGQQLVDLHLLKSPVLEVPIAKFEGTGDGKVEKPRFEAGKVWINATQHFDCVPAEVWQYQIGGYQVCDKWLKDRKGRSLSANDIRHYCRVVTALERTIEVQKQIDELYGGVEKEMIDFV